jgi:glucosylceramidase
MKPGTIRLSFLIIWQKPQRAFPDKFLAFTEGCKEQFKMSGIYEVSLGELYGKNMINDFNKGTALWTDWNIAAG